ncbi:MAG: Small subunit (SSU) processome component [Vezdaea aestivalis]|nr:MAG: Small subunit (SSU) processome component [Vezdaea aestivalis]
MVIAQKRKLSSRPDPAPLPTPSSLKNEDVQMKDQPSLVVVDISSGVEEESDSDEEEDEDDTNAINQDAITVNGATDLAPDIEVNSVEGSISASSPKPAGAEGMSPQSQADQPEEPTFGDLVKANASELIHVEDHFNDTNTYLSANARIPHATFSDTASLGNVLAQALRTDDTELFSTCFSNTDPETIRATVERLESPLATKLLQKLAEVIHRQPGRSGSLIIWIQWTVVTHGGYLASQSKLMNQLGSLQKVLRQRAKALQPLLALKGKLDMLEAQLELRRRMRVSSKSEYEDEDDDEGLIYVEGEDDDEEEDQQPGTITPSSVSLRRIRRQISGARSPETGLDVFDDGDFSDQDMPTTVNGTAAHGDENLEEGSNQSGGLVDDEAEETDNDSESGDELDDSDVDHEFSEHEDEEELESEPEIPPAKRIATKATRVGGSE